MRPFARAEAFVNLKPVVPLPQSEGRVVGRYALYDEIAAGGMATVHIGRLLGPVGFSRTVAIKRLHAQFAKDPEFVSMFLDEARLAARIRHPNVIGTLDVVALSGELFLVMEYVPGDSLARLWRTCRENKQPMPQAVASAIVLNVLEGLHAAHEATNDRGEPLGIVHRDVSPHNVLVGSDGIARVLDFGVAKASGRLQTTRDGQLKGKISYMAPEQVQGIVDRTTDVYAAGVVLWESLTGRRLFFADNEARTLANVLYPHVEAPSRHAIGVAPALDAVVLRALDPSPAGRFQSARDMARALQTALPPASPYDVADWVEQTAGAVISQRAQRVAVIERSTPSESELRPIEAAEAAPRPSGFGLRASDDDASAQSLPFSKAQSSLASWPSSFPPASAPQLPSARPSRVSILPPAPDPPLPRRRGYAVIALAALVVAAGVLGVRAARQPNPRGIPLRMGSIESAPSTNDVVTPSGLVRSAGEHLNEPPGAASLPAPAAASPPASNAAAQGVASGSRESGAAAASSAARTGPHPPSSAPPASARRTPDVEFEHVFDSRK